MEMEMVEGLVSQEELEIEGIERRIKEVQGVLREQ